jgi:hypothetical protein
MPRGQEKPYAGGVEVWSRTHLIKVTPLMTTLREGMMKEDETAWCAVFCRLRFQHTAEDKPA